MAVFYYLLIDSSCGRCEFAVLVQHLIQLLLYISLLLFCEISCLFHFLHKFLQILLVHRGDLPPIGESLWTYSGLLFFGLSTTISHFCNQLIYRIISIQN